MFIFYSEDNTTIFVWTTNGRYFRAIHDSDSGNQLEKTRRISEESYNNYRDEYYNY